MENNNFSLNNKSSIHGIVVRAKEGISKNPQFEFPKIPNDCLIILPKDIIGSNRVEILKETIPLFASSYVSYINQPLFGVFAPNLEIVEDIISKTKITYSDIEEEDKKNTVNEKTIVFEQGNFDQELEKINSLSLDQKTEEDNEKKYLSYKSSLKFSRKKSQIQKTTKIIVEVENDNLNIYCPTQWPAFIINTVNGVCSFNKKKIIVHKKNTYAKKDEMLIQPGILASIASLAALKSKKVVFLHENIASYSPEIFIERETWYSKEENKTEIEKIDLTIDQGASLLFSEEISKHYIAGLIPLYDLKAIKININFIQSAYEPSHFFGGLGYVNAITSSQTHSTKLGKSLGLSPFFWLSQSLSESLIHKKTIEIESIQEQKQTIQELVERSFFNRKYAAYKVNSIFDKKLSTFAPYARGIGLAIAPSISGFSFSNENYCSPKIKLSLNFDGKAELNTSFFNNSKGSKIWKKIISEELDVKFENVQFTEEGPDLIDSGPNVLSVNSGIMASQIKLACDKINEKRFIEGLPISVTLGGTKKGNKTILFSSKSWITMIIEASINPVSLEPIVNSVWVNCAIGSLVDEKSYTSNLKQVIISYLIEMGAKLAKDDEFFIDIKINHKYENISDSITSGIKGVVSAAFNTALEMALNIENISLPITSEKILSAIGENI